MKNNNDPGERIQQFRSYFHLSQGAFSHEIGMSQANVSKIESGQLDISETMLYAIMAKYAVNPEWIKTGQGEMLIAPEEYISKGITLLGAKQFNDGLAKVLNDPRFAEFHALAAFGEIAKDNVDEELAGYMRYMLDFWQQGDERKRHWLLYQLELAFPEAAKRIKKEGDDSNHRMR